MKKHFICYLIMSFIVGLAFFNAEALAQPIELKAIGALAKDHPLLDGSVRWIDQVNREAKGELNIKFLGGPEVIPTFEQVEALRKGVVQIVFSWASYYKALLPECDAYPLSKITATEERKPGGFYEFMVERHKSIGIMYIGRDHYGSYFFWLAKPVKTPKDLAGLKLRTAALYDRFMRKLGAVPVTIAPVDVYTSLERGIVDGAGYPLLGPRENGWTEKLKYIIDHPFFGSSNGLILMNLDTWNKLPKPIQTKLIDLTTRFEPDMMAYYQKKDEREWEELKKIGIKPIKFSPEDAKYYLDTAYQVEWEALEKKIPDLVPKLRKLTGN
jgi:TRAP-type C4-dicarboxylate transport system substrate-binding protein